MTVLTLNRPDTHNAISFDLACAIADAVEAAGTEDRTRVVVIRGAGKSFSAGYDLGTGSYGSRSSDENAKYLRELSRQWERVYRCSIPVIAQVHGYCLAGGTDLAGHCDITVVADDATIGVPAVRSMGVALSQMWLYHVGPQWTKRLLLTGDTITGRLAARIGFALASVPAADLGEEVMRLAHRISLVEREMLIGNKRVINHGIDLMGREALHDMAAQQDALAHETPPARAFAALIRQEGLQAALRARDEPFGHSRLDVHCE
ncbi:enoyl-CoA hydratase/isomerase family protein [Mycolicibacterium pulveris]|uniref:Enoyl-CoA hydratase n=1 Tax=Mycolicibacterium pulveris TaxID=36813 RepID=A0A7I7UNQ1_MYCPV|nr:enoyl-CoA hydratase-related protein [Mycolicibacterium pulveris]MCV6983195.1 enoyl-CoA hydratase/isomerase family protein [Mycolicibacterium pulveris]BBY83065.1 enoyl-CoA hydratase [Mycolicibacterium pulveris]